MFVRMMIALSVLILFAGCNADSGSSEESQSKTVRTCEEILNQSDEALIENSCILNYITLAASEQACCDTWIADRNK